MKKRVFKAMGLFFVLCLVGAPLAFVGAEDSVEDKSIERGRYLVKIVGCNDCHTPGFSQTAGQIPESQWMTGDPVGWHGPWGTTYSGNLRLYFQTLTEDQWVSVAKAGAFRPPMPTVSLREMTESDLRDMYRFIKSLGPAGDPGPSYLPPDKTPEGPCILFPKPPSQ